MRPSIRTAIENALAGPAVVVPIRAARRFEPRKPLQIADAFALAMPMCAKCDGTGMADSAYCGCVYRRGFRECLAAYRSAERGSPWAPRREGASMWGYKSAEYAADFLLVTRRTLDRDLMRIFDLHFLAGLPWTDCGMERGAFFHAVYRIESRLGRVFLELTPYSLYPRSYFAGRDFAKEQFPQSTSVAEIRENWYAPHLKTSLAPAA